MMIGVYEELPEFEIIGVKPFFNEHEEGGVSAFENISKASFPGKWKVIIFYPKDFTFICPTEIVGFSDLNREFVDRDTVVLAGACDNEYSKLAWRREHPDLKSLPIWQFADNGGVFARALGVLDSVKKVPLRATYIVDPHNMVQHVTVNGLNVGRSPDETLRILDGLQSDGLCACNRPVGGQLL